MNPIKAASTAVSTVMPAIPTVWGYSAGWILSKNTGQKGCSDSPGSGAPEEVLESRTDHAIGNTDCYQPIERELEITCKILEVLWKYRHPVGVITKTASSFGTWISCGKWRNTGWCGLRIR